MEPRDISGLFPENMPEHWRRAYLASYQILLYGSAYIRLTQDELSGTVTAEVLNSPDVTYRTPE